MRSSFRTHLPHNWSTCPNVEKRSRWNSIYVSLKPNGVIALNRIAHEAIGSPTHVHLLFDKKLDIAGIRWATPSERNVFRVIPRGKHGGRIIFGHNLLREYAIHVPQTIIFPDAHASRNQTLILYMQYTRPAKRKHRYT